MAGNSEKIDEIIDTAATSTQYKTLVGQVDDLDAKFVALTKEVIAFNKAVADSKGFADFTKNTAAAAVASEKLIDVQNQSSVANIKAQQELKILETLQNKKVVSDNQLTASNARAAAAQEKASQAATKALSPYQQLSKELDKQRLAAKDLGVQYGLNDPRFLKAQEGVLKLDDQLKKLDKSLGQNQRDVGNYAENVKSALESFYEELDKIIPGAGKFSRTVVEGFNKISESAKHTKKDVTDFTQGGFGFKPIIADAPSQIANTGGIAANTVAVEENTAANIENVTAVEADTAAQAEKATVTIAVTDAETGSTAATVEGSAALGVLGTTFALFSTAAFVATIGSAVYYLEQFKSTSNTVTANLAGLKNVVASFGGSIVNRVFGEKSDQEKERLELLKTMSVWERVKYQLSHPVRADINVKDSFTSGKEAEKQKIALANIEELEEAENGQLTAEAERERALSKDKILDISIRQEHLKEAQKIENEILENQKNTANRTIETAIALSQKLKKLKPEQLAALRNEDPAEAFQAAQELALNGRQFTEQAFEVFKDGIRKKISYEQNAANELVRIQNDRDNMQLRADLGLARAQDRLDKARVQSALDAAKLILGNDQSSYDEKIKANQDFVNDSIKLLQIQKRNELDSAGLGSTRGGKDSRTEAVTRLAIETETQNGINKVRTEGLKNAQDIQKKQNDEVTKEYKRRYDEAVGAEKAIIDLVKSAGNERLLNIDEEYSKESTAIAALYTTGVINAETYNSRILELQQSTNAKRLQAQIETQKKLIAIQAVGLVNGTSDPKELQSAAEALVKFQIAASDLVTKTEIDNIHKVEQVRKENADLTKQLSVEGIDLIKELIDNGYQAQIEALQAQAQGITDNANLQKEAVDRGLLSNKQKADQDKVIDAQTASSKLALSNQEKDIKVKEAKFNKAISLVNIAISTAESVAKIEAAIAVAEAQATLYLSNPLTAALYPGIAALIAAQQVEVGLTIASGVAQAAIVAAQPIPKYAKGTKSHPGGRGIVGDEGFELVAYPDGRTFLSADKPTVMDMPEGTTVIPHLETIKALAQIKYAGGQSIDIREVAALLRENNKYQKQIASKPAGNRNLVNDLVAAQQIMDRRNSYFK